MPRRISYVVVLNLRPYKKDEEVTVVGSFNTREEAQIELENQFKKACDYVVGAKRKRLNFETNRFEVFDFDENGVHIFHKEGCIQAITYELNDYWNDIIDYSFEVLEVDGEEGFVDRTDEEKKEIYAEVLERILNDDELWNVIDNAVNEHLRNVVKEGN